MNKISEQMEKNAAAITTLLADGALASAFALATEPLHEALYEHQTFDFLNELSVIERVALVFDYIQSQVAQGGFIQLIQNGYTSLLVTAIEGMQELAILPEMVSVLDDALKVYVLNAVVLSKEVSVAEFAKLYADFKEFEVLEERFDTLREHSIKNIITLLTKN